MLKSIYKISNLDKNYVIFLIQNLNKPYIKVFIRFLLKKLYILWILSTQRYKFEILER